MFRGYLVYQLCSIGPIVENNDKVRADLMDARKLIFAVQHDPKNAPHCPSAAERKIRGSFGTLPRKKEGDCFDTEAIDAFFLTFVPLFFYHGNWSYLSPLFHALNRSPTEMFI